MKRILLDEDHDDLLNYIVAYRKARQPMFTKRKSSKLAIAQQLVVAYAKQLVVGMPDEAWRQTMIQKINECEK